MTAHPARTSSLAVLAALALLSACASGPRVEEPSPRGETAPSMARLSGAEAQRLVDRATEGSTPLDHALAPHPTSHADTHAGPDSHARGRGPSTARAARCFTGTNGIQVLYAYQRGQANDLRAQVGAIRRAVESANGIVYDSSARARSLRIVTGAKCRISVRAVALSRTALRRPHSTLDGALRGAGFQSPRRIYVTFTKTSAARLGFCGMAGNAMWPFKNVRNPANGGGTYARIAGGCWNGHTTGHEILHTLGAVTDNSPNSSKQGHCRDNNDLMCYDDKSGFPPYKIKPCPSYKAEYRLDCGGDDYFNTAPAPGSYLNENYNTADSSFLYGGGPASNAAAPPAPIDTPIIEHDANTGTFSLNWNHDAQVSGYEVTLLGNRNSSYNERVESLYTTDPSASFQAEVGPEYTYRFLIVAVNNRGMSQASFRYAAP